MADSAHADDAETADTPPAGRSAADNVTPIERSERSEGPSRLRDAMRRARMNEADRRDVVISLRESELARLEMLQDALADVVADIPDDADLFDGEILPGHPPRLWIDVLAYVVMGRDKRTYRLVQETRYGRATLLESTDLEKVSQRVTDYIAARLVERKRALAFDDLADLQARLGSEPDSPGPAVASETGPSAKSGANGWQVFLIFLLGIILGAFGLFFYGATQYVP